LWASLDLVDTPKKRFLIDNASSVTRKHKVEVREHLDQQITIKFNRRYLDFHEVFESKPAKVRQS